MGVPKFFTWLSERYPCILVPLTESTIPTFGNFASNDFFFNFFFFKRQFIFRYEWNYSCRNLFFFFFLNFVLKACTHSNDDDKNGPKKKMTDDEIFLKIFQYIEKLFNLIKPRKYFFMGVDGVAPRAKMNQQRSRRFRSAKDAEEARNKAIERGEKVPEIKDVFDSNCISKKF